MPSVPYPSLQSVCLAWIVCICGGGCCGDKLPKYCCMCRSSRVRVCPPRYFGWRLLEASRRASGALVDLTPANRPRRWRVHCFVDSMPFLPTVEFNSSPERIPDVSFSRSTTMRGRSQTTFYPCMLCRTSKAGCIAYPPKRPIKPSARAFLPSRHHH